MHKFGYSSRGNFIQPSATSGMTAHSQYPPQIKEHWERGQEKNEWCLLDRTLLVMGGLREEAPARSLPLAVPGDRLLWIDHRG